MRHKGAVGCGGLLEWKQTATKLASFFGLLFEFSIESSRRHARLRRNALSWGGARSRANGQPQSPRCGLRVPSKAVVGYPWGDACGVASIQGKCVLPSRSGFAWRNFTSQLVPAPWCSWDVSARLPRCSCVLAGGRTAAPRDGAQRPGGHCRQGGDLDEGRTMTSSRTRASSRWRKLRGASSVQPKVPRRCRRS